jgi:DNA-binding beta-propeller fold protein YncE
MFPVSASALSPIFRLLSPRRRAPRSPARNPRRLEVEALEDRMCPSGGYLLVGSFDNNSVLRYSETTGAFVDQFDPKNLANLKNPSGGVFGPDGNLYVSSDVFQKNNSWKVVEYDGNTGAFLRVFASQNITSPRSLLFGPDGNLYVANGNDAASGDPASVERFDGKTGAFLNFFVAPSSGGLEHPGYMVFGPDGKKDGKLDLYVGAAHEGAIYRYDGTTGAFKGVFVTAASGGLDAPAGMVFGADGNLYVASGNWFTSSNGPFYSGDFPPGAVLRFEGPSGKNPGAFLGTFVVGGSGGLANPNGILFGPNGDLFVASCVESGTGGTLIAEPGTSQVLRYDGTTGAFLGTFVTPDSGGLKNAWFLTFTETNPTTLNYDTPSGPMSVSAAPATQTALVTNLAPLASSLLDMRQPALPAAPLPGTVSPSAAPTSQSGFLLTPGASSPAPAGSTDVVFAPFQIAGNDDDAWLFMPLLSGGPDGLISSSSSIKF